MSLIYMSWLHAPAHWQRPVQTSPAARHWHLRVEQTGSALHPHFKSSLQALAA